MANFYNVGATSARQALGLEKTAKALVKYNPLFAAEQVAKAAPKGTPKGFNINDFLSPEVRAGLTYGVPTGLLSGGATYYQYENDPELKNIIDPRVAALIAGTASAAGVGIPAYLNRKELGTLLGKNVDLMDNFIKQRTVATDPTVPGGARGVVEALRRGVQVDPTRPVEYTVQDMFNRGGRQVKGTATSLLEALDSSDDWLANSALGRRVTGHPQVIQELMQRGIRTVPLEGAANTESLAARYIEALKQIEPGITDKQIMARLHPDALSRQQGFSVDPEVARQVYDQLAGNKSTQSGALDAYEQAIHAYGKEIAAKRLEILRRYREEASKALPDAALLDRLGDEYNKMS